MKPNATHLSGQGPDSFQPRAKRSGALGPDTVWLRRRPVPIPNRDLIEPGYSGTGGQGWIAVRLEPRFQRQHSRFILTPGMKLGHRLYFANGIFAYLGGPLVLVLIWIGLAQAWAGHARQPKASLLWGSLALLWVQLLTPRLLGLLRTWKRSNSELCWASSRICSAKPR